MLILKSISTAGALLLAIAATAVFAQERYTGGDHRRDRGEDTSNEDQNKRDQRDERSSDDREFRRRPEQPFERGQRMDGRRREARNTSIDGRVLRTKQVDLRGSQNKALVALVETDQGDRRVVDLGNTRLLRDVRIRTGDDLRASGALKRVGDRQVLFAKEVTVDGQTADIRRQSSARRGDAGYQITGKTRLSGWVITTDTAQLKNSQREHLIAHVRDRQGRRHVVDLGPADRAKQLDLRRDDGVGIAGFEMDVNGRSVILALRAQNEEDEVLDITRSRQGERRGDRSGRNDRSAARN